MGGLGSCENSACACWNLIIMLYISIKHDLTIAMYNIIIIIIIINCPLSLFMITKNVIVIHDY